MSLFPSDLNAISAKLKDYKILQPIGSGGTAEIYLGQSLIDDKQVAIKIVKKSQFSSTEELNKIRDEIKLNVSLHHEHIIKYIEMVETDNFFAVVMEYAHHGSLLNFFSNAASKVGPLFFLPNNNTLKKIFEQVLHAIFYLHRVAFIAHRDIKPDNILLDDEFRVKLTDFGMSKYFGHGNLMKTRCGSPCYVAPEIITNNDNGSYNEKVDIWSLGILLYYLSTNKLPFYDENIQILFRKVLNDKVEFSDDLNIPPLLKELIEKMLEKDPMKRLSIDEVINHKYWRSEHVSCRATSSVIVKWQSPNKYNLKSSNSEIQGENLKFPLISGNEPL